MDRALANSAIARVAPMGMSGVGFKASEPMYVRQVSMSYDNHRPITGKERRRRIDRLRNVITPSKNSMFRRKACVL